MYFGADSQGTVGTLKRHATNGKNAKVTTFKNGVIIAHAGVSLVGQILASNSEWFKVKSDEEFNKEFIVKKIVPNPQDGTPLEEEFSDE